MQTLLGLLASAVVPTLVVRSMRRGSEQPRGHRLAAWWCLWAGQWVVPLAIMAWVSMSFGPELHRLGSLPAALVYGGGGAALALLLVVRGVALWRAGTSILRGGSYARVSRGCTRVGLAALVGLGGATALFWLMTVLPIPGRFGALLYLMLVLAPVGIASLVFLAVAACTLRLVQPRAAQPKRTE